MSNTNTPAASTVTYTVSVVVQLAPPSRFGPSVWKHPVYQIEAEASWYGFGQACAKAFALAEEQYGERMLVETSYVQQASPLPWEARSLVE